MTQDLSRDFLQSGRDEDKYRFFMKATLLDKVRFPASAFDDCVSAGKAAVHPRGAEYRLGGLIVSHGLCRTPVELAFLQLLRDWTIVVQE